MSLLSIFNYQLVEPLILPNTLINLLTFSQKSSASHQSSSINYKLLVNL